MTINFHPQILESVLNFLEGLNDSEEIALIKSEILEITKSWEAN